MKAARLPSLALLALAACGEAEDAPLDASTVALTARDNVRHVAGELADALAFLEGTRAGALLGGCADEEACEPLRGDELAETFAHLLSERIFTGENVEAEGPGSITFRLRPEQVCPPGDDACATFLREVPIRLEVTSDAPGDLDVAVLVGAARHRPAEVALHAERLELQVDLAELRATLVLLGVDEVELPAVMVGRLSLGVARHEAGDFTLSLSVLEALSVRSHGYGPWELELGEALPAVAARVRAPEQRIAVRLGLGALSLRGPIESLFGAGEAACAHCIGIGDAAPDGTAGLTAAGLTAEATFERLDDGAEVLRLRGVGLGDDTALVDVEGAPLLTVDLGTFDLDAAADAGGTELAFSPGLDLELGLYFSNLADRFDVPDWAMEETLRVRVDGAATPRLFLPADAPDDGGARTIAAVRAGALELGSDARGVLRVEAGMCLMGDGSEGDHPFGGLAVSACE